MEFPYTPGMLSIPELLNRHVTLEVIDGFRNLTDSTRRWYIRRSEVKAFVNCWSNNQGNYPTFQSEYPFHERLRNGSNRNADQSSVAILNSWPSPALNPAHGGLYLTIFFVSHRPVA